MNDLEKYFKENVGRRIVKLPHYFDIYETHLEKYRGKQIGLLEIGVGHGGSMQMWQSYFGSRLRCLGIDNNRFAKSLEGSFDQLFIGDQGNRRFLGSIKTELQNYDVVIDDGSHCMADQIISFEELFPRLNNGGIYLVEDVHSSYKSRYGGGYRKKGSFIEYTKDLIDAIHAVHSEQRKFRETCFSNLIRAIYCYDGVVVLEKSSSPEKKKERRIVRSGSIKIEMEHDLFPKQSRISNLRKIIRYIKTRVRNRFKWLPIP